MSITCRIIVTRANLTHWRECIDLRAQLQIVYNIEYRDYSASHKRLDWNDGKKIPRLY